MNAALSIADMKTSLRQEARAVRAAIPAELQTWAAERVADFLVTELHFSGHYIGGYWPLPGELDPRPALRRAQAGGAKLALPGEVLSGQAMQFRAWDFGDPLIPGPHGTLLPEPQQPLVIPDILWVPLLAFDSAGFRLGYGGGYYDRTIAHLRENGPRPLVIGLAFACQERGDLSHDQFDQRLDLIVTEQGARRFT